MSNGRFIKIPRNQFISGWAKPFSAKAGPMAVSSKAMSNGRFIKALGLGRFIKAEAAKWPDI